MNALTEETEYVPLAAPVVDMPMFCTKGGCDRMLGHDGLCIPDLTSLAELTAQVAEMHEMFTRMKPMFGAFTR